MPSVISAGTTAGTAIAISGDTTGNLAFQTNGTTTAMTIDTNQVVGIGTTTPLSWTKLQINGTAGAQTLANQQLNIVAPTTTVGQGAGIRLSAASGAKEAVGVIGMVNEASGNLGALTFHTYNGGATIPEYMRIDSSGRVTTPSQPCFYVYTYSNNTSGVSKSFSNTAINIGNCWNNSNGRFTAPIAGIYEFRASFLGVNETITRAQFYLNDAPAYNADVNQARLDGIASGSELPFAEVTIYLSLSANDFINLVVGTDNGANLVNLSWGKFCGRLMQ